ncbi:hypothetical protein C8J56DRAFT_1054190 [Mycena floridula]|nr:hypothetical protein C8J56DRAFT_1054190 [Mycena floridula]
MRIVHLLCLLLWLLFTGLNRFGAAFIGVIVGACLHGVSCVQAWYYFTHHHDRWPLRLLVAAVFIFDTIHQILISHCLYVYLVSNFSNPAGLGVIVWSLLVEVIFNGLTALLVQSFLTLRVWRIGNKNFWIVSVIFSIVLAEFCCVILYAGIAITQDQTFVELGKLKAISITVNGLAAAGDVIIAAALSFFLHTSRTGFRRSDTMINKLIVFAVNTGFLTSLCAIASLISIITAPNTFLYISFFFIIGRLYSNSLLASLNARKMIRTASEGVNTTSDGRLSLGSRGLRHLSQGGSGSWRIANISTNTGPTKEFSRDCPYQGTIASAPSPISVSSFHGHGRPISPGTGRPSIQSPYSQTQFHGLAVEVEDSEAAGTSNVHISFVSPPSFLDIL